MFASVCSGIEAASAAWHPLGWRAAFFSEIEPFPCAALAHHYPDVPNLGDMTKYKDWPDADFDVLVGGTPCQSFSVAGLRKGLADPRGNLMLTYLAIAARYRPRWLVWENVPGVLSSAEGRDFQAFLEGLGVLGYGWAYRVLDAQYFGVAQRRRRVFVVGCLGSWASAAAVLFELESLRGDLAPSREAGKVVANSPVERPDRGGGNSEGQWLIPLTAQTHTRGGQQRLDPETETLIPTTGGGFNVAHALRGEGFDASEDGTGRGTPLVPVPFDTTQVTSKANRSNPKAGDPCHPLAAGAHAPAIAIQERAISENVENGPQGKGYQEGVAYTLEARHHVQSVQSAMQVRRLTPRECERLQGFPDDYTLIPYRGKPAADGPRYKALGNSMAVPVMAWIGERIAMCSAHQGGGQHE